MKKYTALTLAASIMISVFPVVSYAAYENNGEDKLAEITYNYDGENYTRYMEKLDRGLVAVKVNNGVYLSWRLLGDESSVKDIVNAPCFKVYKNGTLIKTVDNSTNYLDTKGTSSDMYSVAAEGGDQCEAVTPMANNYFDIDLDKPAAFTYSDGENTYTHEYSAGDASCGDLDGDGEYEIVLKWDANPQDNSNGGITGNVLLDAYKLDGTRLWRIDLGKNIRAGAHYTQFLVYDFDGDGKAEITAKTAPGSVDGKGNYVTAASSDSAIRSADNTADYRNSGGYILDGPEYFTIFGGETGEALDTINYPVQRVSASVWGDSYGNRCDRFIADVSYLDGVRPYAVYWRGYYFGQAGYSARTGVFAASFDGERLSVPTEHIFDTRSDQPGYTSGNERYVGQGNHNMTSGDFDDDGKDEFTAGALALEFDENNKLVPMWCTYKEHGDAIHIGDYDPTHRGLELFVIHEDGGGTNSYGGVALDYGCSVIDPATGGIMWHSSGSKDTGRGLMANVGAGGYYQVTATAGVGGYYSLGGGNMLKGTAIGYNFRIFWDADLYDETLDGTTVSAWDGTAMSAIFSAGNYGCVSINGTKSVPVLQADLFGDWREELVYPTSDNNRLRVFTTTDVTDYKLPTLMHDPVYRSGVASEQSAYNQPPHIGFYLADEMFRAAVDHLEITHSPDKTTYYVGEALDATGLTVIAHFTDGSTDDVSEHVVLTGYEPSSAGDQIITVTYGRHTAEFGVFVDAGFTIDDDGYITGYTQSKASAVLPTTISGMTVKGIREGALRHSGLSEITINSEEMDIEPDAFPEGIRINCILGSDVYIYAVNNNISYLEIDVRDYTFNIDYDEAVYNGMYMYMTNSSQNYPAGHIHYYVGGRANKDGTNGGDGNSGFGINDDGGDSYISCGVGRFHTSKRNAYFILEDLPVISNSTDTVFQTDIRFDSNDGRKAKILIFDTSELTYWGRNNTLLTVPIDTVSETLLSQQHNMSVDEDSWYTYKLICHNGKYYRSFAPRGEKADYIELGECSSQFGAIRFDFMAADDSSSIGNNQKASISLDNTKLYTNTEIAYLDLEITDKNGNAIPNAAITIDGAAHTADKNGMYSAEIMSGLYDVTVSADGYRPTELSLAVFKSKVEKTIVLSPVLSPLESVSFVKDNIALKEGQTAAAELVRVPENAEETAFNYSSSDDAVATVGANGIIIANKAGTARITAVSADNADIRAECTVTVYEPYNSIVASIVIEGPDTAYVPNNSAANLVKFAARCYDSNGVEMKNVKGIKWAANGALSISDEGVLTIPQNKNTATYTVNASYNDIKSNDRQITLIAYPDSSDIIAKEDCSASLDTAQGTVVQTTSLGDITYVVGARAGSGDRFSGFYIGTFDGKRCLYAKAGQYASAGREAYMVFDKIKDAAAYETDKDYIFETDLYFTGNEKMILEDSYGNAIMQLEPGVAGMSVNTWYHYMLIYNDGVYIQYVTDADGNYTETQIPTLMNSGVISQIRFAKGDTNYETIYLRGLKYYTVESAFSNITVKTVDADGAALADVAVDVSGNTAVTNAVGVAKLTLPLGAYIASAAKDGYSASVGVMSMGINKVYTLTLGDTSVEPEPLITGIDRVNGNSIIVSTNGEGLRLYAAKYDNGVLKNIYAADAEEGTVLYNAGFEPDKVFLWDLNLTPFDKWEK